VKNLRIILTSTLMLIASFSNYAVANDKAVVQTFYDFLSNPASEEQITSFKAATDENWTSIGDYSGTNKTRDAFIGQVSGFFAELIPDLNWEVQEMLQEGNKVVVRSRATGTPNAPLFGVDGKGKSFDILTIDIHTLEGDKIVSTYHVEDWAGALQQLSAE